SEIDMGIGGFDKLPIVPILQVGISGFCFLLALFAYLLLRREQREVSPRITMLRFIKSFMTFALLLGLLVALSAIVQALLDQSLISGIRRKADRATALRNFCNQLKGEYSSVTPADQATAPTCITEVEERATVSCDESTSAIILTEHSTCGWFNVQRTQHSTLC